MAVRSLVVVHLRLVQGFLLVGHFWVSRAAFPPSNIQV